MSYLEGLSNYLGADMQVHYTRGLPSFADMAEATSFTTAATNGQPGLNAEYFNNPDLQGPPAVTRTERRMNFGQGSRMVLPPESASSRWTGYYVPQASGAHDIFVHTSGENGGAYRVYVDDKLMLDNWTINKALANYVTCPLEAGAHKVVLERRGRSQGFGGGRTRLGIVRHGQFVSDDARKLAAKADVVVVAAGFDQDTESEGADRTFYLPPGQDELIQEMAAANKNTVVVHDIRRQCGHELLGRSRSGVDRGVVSGTAGRHGAG